MRAEIRGTIYNTELVGTNKIATTAHRESNTDPYNFDEYQSLYKTREGRFFIAYLTLREGHHSRIEVVSDQEAQEFCHNFGLSP